MGRLRRARDHRPLGADGRAVDAEAARHPVDGAERAGADPGARRARARPRRRGRPGAARGEFAPLAGGRRLDPRRTAACPTSRTPTGAACAPSSGGLRRPRRASRCGTRGCELEIGRGDASIHWDEALERGRPFFALATDDSHHPGYDSGFAWTWVRAARAARRRRCSTRCAPACSTARPGPEIRDVEVSDGDVVVRCSPARSVTLYSGRPRGARANAGRLGYPNHVGRPRARRRRPDHGVRGSSGRRARRTAASRCSTRTATRPGRTRCGPRSSTRAARVARFDLLVIGGGIIGAGIAEAATAHGLERRARRARRLRVGDVERVVEADPRRAALPADGRRPARPRGAPGAARADERRRAAPRAPAAVRLPALRQRAAPAVVRAAPGARSTRARAREAERARQRASARYGSCRSCAPSGSHSSALYADAWTNDGRLTLANVRAAADRGAAVLNYAEVVGAPTATARRSRSTGETVRVRGARDRQRDRALARPRAPARGSERARRRCG